MNAVVNTVLPVFGLIMVGYALAKANIIDAQAGRGITLFVFNIAIPAFLFRTVASITTEAGAPWALWFAYFGGLGLAWLCATVISRFVVSLDFSGGAAAAMATSFGNLALLGTPLALAHFGPEIAVPLGMILSVHAPVLWTAAILHRELARQSATLSLRDIFKSLAKMLLGNALILALLAGGLWRLSGLGLHPVPDKMLAMLSDAGVPTALLALGASLAAYSLRGSWGGMAVIMVLKMIAMPFFVFALARYVVHLPVLWLKVAVLFASMPTGANAFLFSQRNDEAVPAVTGAVALGTGFAAVTAGLLLWLMDSGLISLAS